MSFGTRNQGFLQRNRDKGIPNLMLYIVLGNAVVTVMSLLNGGAALFYLLCFDKALIMQGQVWRLFTFVFTQTGDGLFGLIFLYFFYMLGRQVELRMGTLRFNLYYLCGVILMDIFAFIFYTDFYAPIYWNMSYYLHLSLLLTFATTNPQAQFLILFIIPIKAWVMALIYLFLVFAEVFNLSYPIMHFPHNLFPLVAVANYLLFMWRQIPDLIPIRRKPKKQKATAAPRTGPIPFRPTQRPDFSHRCTICGRTDRTNPELEFRYCSRCAGYHCYCIDHINDHTHIQ